MDDITKAERRLEPDDAPILCSCGHEQEDHFDDGESEDEPVYAECLVFRCYCLNFIAKDQPR